MKLLLTTNGRLYKNPQGEYYTPIVYGYSFFKRYFDVFERIRLVAHVTPVSDAETEGMLRVDGENLEVFEVFNPVGKIQYIKYYRKIKKQVKHCYVGCDVALLRVPDQLAFQVYSALRGHIPCGIEVTSNSWELYGPGCGNSPLRPIIRLIWDSEQKKVCRLADASSYVTHYTLQKRYPPKPNTFTTYYSNADPGIYKGCVYRDYGSDKLSNIKLLHVSGFLRGRVKGHKELIEAAAMLKNDGFKVECILVGSGELDSDIQQIVDNNVLVIRKTGRLTPEQIKTEMLSSDFFVFPSYREGLPRVVVEAMASGIMCVGSSIDGNKELLSESVLVPKQDSMALFKKIKYYAENPQLMTEQSKRNILESSYYSAEQLTKRRIDYYKKLYAMAGKDSQ
jgi:glycosyltransferase involved in cell wall biosynthesis